VNRAFLILILSATLVFAQQPWPRHVVDDAKLQFEYVSPATLPKALREALLSFDEFSSDGEQLPEVLGVLAIDLNLDGKTEYIVSSNVSYTGGSAHVVYQRSKSGYHHIAYIQGGFHLTERHHGYYQIETWSRAGGGKLTRILERFERGRYRIVRIEDYTDDDEPRFLGVRNPKEYDHD
jgi:hypothetical protein